MATILRRRKIPFVFASGYGTDGLSDDFRNELIVQKPYEPQDLRWAIKEACARAS